MQKKKGEKLKTMKSFRFLEDGDDLRIIWRWIFHVNSEIHNPKRPQDLADLDAEVRMDRIRCGEICNYMFTYPDMSCNWDVLLIYIWTVCQYKMTVFQVTEIWWDARIIFYRCKCISVFLIRSMYFASGKRDGGQCHSKSCANLATNPESRSTWNY